MAGCYQQLGADKCLNVQSSENCTDSDNSLHKTGTGNILVDYDSLIGNNNTRIASTSLLSAAETVGSSVMEKPRLYTCDVCSQGFSTGAMLRWHRCHHKDCITCTNCGQSFYSATVLRHHLLMECPRKMVTCNSCCESFDGWPHLSSHTSMTHPAASLCPLCGQAFPHADQLLAHRTVHATNVYQCRTCHLSFRSRRRMKRHVLKHITDCDVECISEGCLKALTGDGCNPENKNHKDTSGNWIKEIKKDEPISGYSLNEVIKDTNISYQQKESTGAACVSESVVKDCNALHPASAYSEVHRLLPMPSSGCTLPAAVASSNGHIDGHRIILRFDKQTHPNYVLVANPPPKDDAAVKAESTERVTCAECSQTFKRLSDLHVHMQCHTGEMRYKCGVCDRPFRKSGTLARHMRIHTGERPYVCETCGKSYKLLFHLRLHMTVHSSDRPFSCDVCSKAFQSAASLKKHRFVHTGVKPFSCPVCLRLFNRCSNMRAHMRVHDGARQLEIFGQEHVCILCRKKFGSATGFQAHLQTHAHQIELDVGETITTVDPADSFGTELTTYCKVEKQQTEDVYVALPFVHFDNFDVS